MPIEVKLHEIDISHMECVLTIIDNGVTVIERANIGLQLKEDGSADNDWIQLRVKEIVSEYRMESINSIEIHKDGN